MTRHDLRSRAITILLTTSLCTALATAAAEPAQTGNHHDPASLGGLLRHSDIVLMPEGTRGPPETMLPLNPTVVAWGNDAVSMLDRPAALKKRMDAYQQLGIRLLACNVWMLTATDRVLYAQPQYQDAVCVDIAGNKIVPPWLDSEHQGVKPYWGCTNHPLFRRQVMARAKAGMEAGANMLHLDDHLGTSAAAQFAGVCFCDHCTHGFRDWLQKQHSHDELKVLGVENIESFDYRQLVQTAGFKTFDEYQKGTWEKRVPLRDQFLAFQREVASEFVKDLGKMAAEQAGRDVPVGVNAFNLSPTQLSDSHVADYFANEVEHYGVEDTVPPLVYKLGSALGKPVFSTGAGHDWIEIGQDRSVTRVQRWIATAYALGHYSMYAQRKWGFTKETGTRWYSTPIATYQPLTQFITNNSSLFDGYEAVEQIGVLYSNRACRENHWQVRQICRELHYANIPFGLVLAGDDWLQRRLTVKELSRFNLTIVPQPAKLDGHQAELIDQWQEQGRAIPWKNLADVQRRVTPWVALPGSNKAWALARVRPDTPQSPVVIHLLNQDYDADSDKMRPSSDLKVRVSKALLGESGARTAVFFAPGAEPVSLATKNEAGDLILNVSRLDLWGIIRIERVAPHAVR